MTSEAGTFPLLLMRFRGEMDAFSHRLGLLSYRFHTLNNPANPSWMTNRAQEFFSVVSIHPSSCYCCCCCWGSSYFFHLFFFFFYIFFFSFVSFYVKSSNKTLCSLHWLGSHGSPGLSGWHSRGLPTNVSVKDTLYTHRTWPRP